ncbi:hypothetical protein TSOC_009963 [Tetrabaena socialis]|uniref:tRNA-specific 2-thiouridylase MnmA-like C-terminal domain-containing protein n=1 Tax=Tetrabaena socialis TaxID=47790 RepID=A0A2J7ZUI1_9CHLO|nr:hypothetical protein TSOC_009963 [Tetrabaena socialis]|eukprot:PNH03931.1 hypothetical protein TSOC_009963 [Tetrabaena socialis]
MAVRELHTRRMLARYSTELNEPADQTSSGSRSGVNTAEIPYYDGTQQRNAFTCGPFNWLDPNPHPPARPDPRDGAPPLLVKVRHGPNLYGCTLRLHDEHGDGSYGSDSYGTVVLEADDQGLAEGQYAVFYQGGRCLGSAVIQGPAAEGEAEGQGQEAG